MAVLIGGSAAFAEDTLPAAMIAACDQAAGSPYDKELPSGSHGIALDKIEYTVAINSCKAAADVNPDIGRIWMQLGRAYFAAKNFDPARDAYERAVKLGNALAANNLASIYSGGLGSTNKDDAEAARLFRLAAENGVAVAQSNLANFYQSGRGGLNKDESEAVRLFRLSANQGYAPSQYSLAVACRNGKGGLAKDDREAARLFQLAANQDYAPAQHMLGYFFQEGLGGLPKDEAAAARLFQSAAKQGNVAGQFSVGLYHLTGRGGLPKDEQEALRLYKLAADHGYAAAQNNLANFFEKGAYGISKDEAQALRLYRLAASQGLRESQYNLALYYEEGRSGLEKNNREALRLYRLAAEQGDEKSRSAADRVLRKNPELLDVATGKPEKRVALVIGNSAYRSVPVLPNPVRDAASIAQVLRNVGFQSVVLAKDVTRDKAVAILRDFAREADTADWAVIYYAGHGIEIGGMNYLIPVDANLVSDRDVQFEAVGLEQAMSAAEGAKKLRLILLDACRDNPFANQIKRSVASRSVGRGLGQVEPDSGMLVVYAAKHGQIALDGDGVNSPFATALIKRISTPKIEVRKLFDLVRDDVMAATQRRQQPFSYGSVPGAEDFYFMTKAVSAP